MTGRQQRLEETVRLSDRIISSQAVRLASSKALASLLLNIVHTDLAQEGTGEEEGGDICLGMRCNMVVLVQYSVFFCHSPFLFSLLLVLLLLQLLLLLLTLLYNICRVPGFEPEIPRP